MQTVSELRHFWEREATPAAKHHTGDLEPWFDFVDQTLLGKLEAAQPPLQTAIDWGCGQGGVSLRMAQRGLQVHAVDLVDESLRRARARLATKGFTMQGTYQVDDPLDLELPMERVDLLLSVAVVQHFPSYAYWQRVASRWRQLQPRYIVLQTRNAPGGASEAQDYRRNYIHALWMCTEAVLQEFPDHDPVFHHIDRAPNEILWSDCANYEFFILRHRYRNP